jgi:hypothetical protein
MNHRACAVTRTPSPHANATRQRRTPTHHGAVLLQQSSHLLCVRTLLVADGHSYCTTKRGHTTKHGHTPHTQAAASHSTIEMDTTARRRAVALVVREDRRQGQHTTTAFSCAAEAQPRGQRRVRCNNKQQKCIIAAGSVRTRRRHHAASGNTMQCQRRGWRQLMPHHALRRMQATRQGSENVQGRRKKLQARRPPRQSHGSRPWDAPTN